MLFSNYRNSISSEYFYIQLVRAIKIYGNIIYKFIFLNISDRNLKDKNLNRNFISIK